jgi:subtilisin family serine protease
MVTLMHKTLLVVLAVGISGIFSFGAAGRTSPAPPAPEARIGRNTQAEYEPYTLILQLTPGAAAAARLDSSPDGSGQSPSLGLPSLDRLIKTHGVREITWTGPSASRESAAPARPQVDPELAAERPPVLLKLLLEPSLDPGEIAAAFQADPNVQFAEPNYIYKSTYIPNDSFFSAQWALHNTGAYGYLPDADIDAPEAWDIELGDPSIVIAVIDTGLDWQHADIAANLWHNRGEIPNNGIDDDGNGYIDDWIGWDFVTATWVAPGEDGYPEDNDPMDVHGHGTHVAGIAAAVGDNGFGISGVCPRCTIMALRAGFKDSGGGGQLLNSDVINAVYYAAYNGADVVNMSFGGGSYSYAMQSALFTASNYGVTLVAAAGNSISAEPNYPAAYPNVIAVTATDQWDQRSVWTPCSQAAFGVQVDLAAPGSWIFSTYPGWFEYMSGTSMSAPFVSGAAGLILSRNPDFDYRQVRSILTSTADTINTDHYIGAGRLNLHRAVMMQSIPSAELYAPEHLDYLKGTVEVTGRAAGEGFQGFVLEYRPGSGPAQWIPILESSNPVYGGVLAAWDTSAVAGGQYVLRLRVTDQLGSTSVQQRLVFIDQEMASGWPRYFGYGDLSSPIIADINRDGQNEIIFSVIHSGMVYVLRADGSSMPGWPRHLGEFFRSGPAVADLTGDGKLEIVIGSVNSGWPPPDNFLHVLRYDGSDLPGWPVNVARQNLGTPALGDLDGDGLPEVLVSTWTDYDDPPHPGIFAFKANGSPLPGWPKYFTMPANYSGDNTSGPALGDLDGDGSLDVVMGLAGGLVYAWDAQGRDLPGWPQQTNPDFDPLSRGMPNIVLGDLDGSGSLEVIASSLSHEVRVFRSDGSLMPGWPFIYAGFAFGPAALADLTGDGKLEVLAHSNSDTLYAWRYDGSFLEGWPVRVQIIEGNPPWQQPVVGDVTGDGQPEVIWGSWEFSIVALQVDGSPAPGWPKPLRWQGFQTPALGDLNGDGLLDLLAPSFEYLYLWNFDSPAKIGQVQWGTYQHDAARSGRYSKESPPPALPTPTSPAPPPIPTATQPTIPRPSPTATQTTVPAPTQPPVERDQKVYMPLVSRPGP